MISLIPKIVYIPISAYNNIHYIVHKGYLSEKSARDISIATFPGRVPVIKKGIILPLISYYINERYDSIQSNILVI